MTPEETIRDKCWKAERLGVAITPFRPGLVFRPDGSFYDFKEDQHCTVLESVLLGDEECTGNVIADAARILGVSEDWVRGFVAGHNVALVPRTPDTDIRNGDTRSFTSINAMLDSLKSLTPVPPTS